MKKLQNEIDRVKELQRKQRESAPKPMLRPILKKPQGNTNEKNQ